MKNYKKDRNKVKRKESLQLDIEFMMALEDLVEMYYDAGAFKNYDNIKFEMRYKPLPTEDEPQLPDEHREWTPGRYGIIKH